MAPLLCTSLSKAGSEDSTQNRCCFSQAQRALSWATAEPDPPACRARFAGAQSVPAPKCAHTSEYVTLIYSPLEELCGEHHLMISKGSVTFSHPQLFWKSFRWARISLREVKLLQPDVLSQCSAYSAGSASKTNRSKYFCWYIIWTNTSVGKPNSPFHNLLLKQGLVLLSHSAGFNYFYGHRGVKTQEKLAVNSLQHN